MSTESEVERLEHIGEACELIDEYVEGLTKEQFMNDQKTIDGVVRRFEVIGEAIANLSDELKQAHDDVEWKEWKDFRNLLIHQYPNVKNEILWKTIQNELDDFGNKIQHCLESLQSDE